MHDNRVRRVMDTGLSSLDMREVQVAALLNCARGGNGMKRKRPAVLALVLALVLLAGGVAAVTLGWTEAAQFLRKERQGTTFHQWSLQEQIHLVDSLVADGYIEETEQVKRMRDERLDTHTRSALAKDIMTSWLSRQQEHVTFQTIMERIWGDFRAWTVEQKVWFTSTLTEAGVQRPDIERYVLPAPDAIDGPTAVRIASAQAAAWMGIPFERLSQYQAFTAHVVFPKEVEQDGQRVYTTENQQPVWLVELSSQSEQDESQLIYVEVDPQTGRVHPQHFITALRMGVYGYQDWPDTALATEQFLAQQGFAPMMAWTHEVRAKWSADIRPLALREAQGGTLDPVTQAYCRYVYGVPEADGLPEAEAIAAARRAARSLPSDGKASVAAYETAYALYEMSGDVPVWRVHLAPQNRQADLATDGHPETAPRYRVTVDPQTGEVLQAETYTLQELAQGEGIAGLL